VAVAPLPSDDPARRKPAIELARMLLEWTPEIELRAGLGWTLEYFGTTAATAGAAS
jgi:nucleoside-diphosphate-sugar epimerase